MCGPQFRHLFAVALFALAALLTFPGSADAQSGRETPTLVVLNVPKGGTDALVSEFRSTGKFAVEGQGWFIEQIRQLGMSPRGIMSNSDNLGRVMRTSGIDYILYLVPDGDNYEARLVTDSSGSPAFTTQASMSDAGLSAGAARGMREEIVAYLASQRQPSQPTTTQQQTEEQSEEQTQEEDGEEKTEEKKKEAKGDGASNILWATGRFRLIKRDLTVAGANNSVVIYASTFYPGLEIDAEVYPLGLADPSLRAVGLMVDFIQGFESIPFQDAEGNQTNLSVSQTEFEVGPIFRLLPPDPGATIRRRVRVKTSVRYSSYGITPNPKLPSTNQTAVILGARLTQPLLSDSFALEADLELIPIAFFGKGGDLFGESSTTHGFTTRLGAMYAFTDALRAVAGYRFRLHHTRFVGRGASNFIDSEGFELVQGIDVGLQYRY